MIWLKGIIEFVFEMVSMINTFMYMNFTTGIQLLEFFWEKCFKFPQALEIMKIIFLSYEIKVINTFHVVLHWPPIFPSTLCHHSLMDGVHNSIFLYIQETSFYKLISPFVNLTWKKINNGTRKTANKSVYLVMLE